MGKHQFTLPKCCAITNFQRARTCRLLGQVEFSYQCSAEHEEQVQTYAPSSLALYTTIAEKASVKGAAGSVPYQIQCASLRPVITREITSNMKLTAERGALALKEQVLDSMLSSLKDAKDFQQSPEFTAVKRKAEAVDRETIAVSSNFASTEPKRFKMETEDSSDEEGDELCNRLGALVSDD